MHLPSVFALPAKSKDGVRVVALTWSVFIQSTAVNTEAFLSWDWCRT